MASRLRRSRLIVCSIVALGATTQGFVDGNPYYYVIRQSIYAVIGIALMFALARFDYSRFRELRVGIYAAMIFLIIAVFAARRPRRAARSARSNFPSSTSSRPSSASCCLSSLLPAS